MTRYVSLQFTAFRLAHRLCTFTHFTTLFVVVVGWTAMESEAAFVNGVERFDGTTLDLDTWELYRPGLAGR